MTIATVRRLAADIMNVGQNKVRISPDGLKEAEGALTRSDVKGLIEKGIIKKLKPQGRASTRRSSRIGRGRRKGTPLDSKAVWMEKVRAQRRFLFMLLDSGALAKDTKRALYRKVKSGIFRNKRAMLLYLKDNGLVPANFEPEKAKFVPKEQKPKKAKMAQKPQEAKAEKAKPAQAALGKASEPAKHETSKHETSKEATRPASAPEAKADKGERR